MYKVLERGAYREFYTEAKVDRDGLIEEGAHITIHAWGVGADTEDDLNNDHLSFSLDADHAKIVVKDKTGKELSSDDIYTKGKPLILIEWDGKNFNFSKGTIINHDKAGLIRSYEGDCIHTDAYLLRFKHSYFGSGCKMHFTNGLSIATTTNDYWIDVTTGSGRITKKCKVGSPIIIGDSSNPISCNEYIEDKK